jgi:hypothetical protein
VALLAEETQLAAQVQGEGANPDVGVDEFNATMDRANSLIDRYNAALDEFSRHFSETQPEIT